MNAPLLQVDGLVKHFPITGGILGRVVDVGDSFLTLEIADGVRIKVQKSQVSQLVPKGTYKSA